MAAGGVKQRFPWPVLVCDEAARTHDHHLNIARIHLDIARIAPRLSADIVHLMRARRSCARLQNFNEQRLFRGVRRDMR